MKLQKKKEKKKKKKDRERKRVFEELIYNEGTYGQGQTYFLSVGYDVSDEHSLNFLMTGAPQWHAAAGRADIGTFIDNGIRFNDWNSDNINSPNTLGNSGV